MDKRLGWIERADLRHLAQVLGADAMRWVGGSVRDSLLGVGIKDIDAATILTPDAVMARCAGAGIRTIPTGIEHGTVTALLEGGPVEITTLRLDVATDGRRATVAFTQDWREDAARRDFTINALYADPMTGEIFDYFGGLEDLAARRVRFIGEARARIREDHLRILRYFRFQARFGTVPADGEAPDGEAEAACGELAPMLKGLSRERVGAEVLNLLGLADPAPVVARMAELGVLGEILPEARVEDLPGLIEAERRFGVGADGLRRLAAMLREGAEGVAARFRVSSAQKKRLVLASRRLVAQDDAGWRALAYRHGAEAAGDWALMAGVAPLSGWTRPVFGVKGREIVARGVAAGPEVARLLLAVEDRWIAEDFPDAGRVAVLLDETMAEVAREA